MTALVACPLCGAGEGYTIHKTEFAGLHCAACRERVALTFIDSNYDAAWNSAGAHAQSLRERWAALEAALRGLVNNCKLLADQQKIPDGLRCAAPRNAVLELEPKQ